jgi:hypothetical protein
MTAYQLDPDDRLAGGGLVIPWPGLTRGEVVMVEIGEVRCRARIRIARHRYAIADLVGEEGDW